MKINKWILVIVALGIVAFGSYRLGRNSTAPANASQIEEQVKNELITLTAKDFEEYQNLKGLEERYKKADEILGKIVTVFLADLGLKLSFQPANPALIEGSCVVPMAAATPLPPSSAPAMDTNSSNAVNNDTIPTEAAKESVATAKEWMKNERELLSIQNEEHALEELKKMPIPDIYKTVANGTQVATADELEMKGLFSGEILFFDKKTYPSDWLIRLRIQFSTRDAEENNQSYITLSKKSDGKTFSTSRSSRNGLVSQNFSRTEGSRALLVNVYGDDGYIQIYPLGGNRRTWVGNYYQKIKLGRYDFVGQVTLSRQ